MVAALPTHPHWKVCMEKQGPLLPKDGRHPQVLMALAQPPDNKQRQYIRRGQCLQGSGEHKWVPTWCCTHPPTPLCQAAAREKGHFLPDKYKGFKCADEAHTSPTGMHLVTALFKEKPALEWGGRNGEEVPALRLPSFHPCSTSFECQRHFCACGNNEKLLLEEISSDMRSVFDGAHGVHFWIAGVWLPP